VTFFLSAPPSGLRCPLRQALPTGTQVLPTPDPNLPADLSEAHRGLKPPEGMGWKKFAEVLKKAVGW